MKYPRLLTDEEVDQAVEEWHERGFLTCKLHEYLGWTWAEYAHWVETCELPKSDKYKDESYGFTQETWFQKEKAVCDDIRAFIKEYDKLPDSEKGKNITP